MRWSIFIFAVTFVLSCAFTVTSTALLEGFAWGVGMLIVFGLVLVGVVFDMMGLAAASAVEKPFHAMASEKVKGAKQAIYIVRNADKFPNFCNDVIGDIAGVISGTASALVVLKLVNSMFHGHTVIYTIISVLFTALVSAFTVGGKAVGKSFAIHYATEIVLAIGKFFYFLERRCGIRLFNGRKNKSNGKRGTKRAAKSN
jgi:CBS domain containing-hemolysin-like protein